MQFWAQRVSISKIISTAFFHGQANLDPSKASPSSTRWFIKVVSTLCIRHSQSLAVFKSVYFRYNMDPFVAFGVIHHIANGLNNPNLAFNFFRFSRHDLNITHSKPSFDLLLRSLCQNNLHDSAELAYDYMKSDGISPNSADLDFLISSFANSGKIRVAEKLLIAKAESCKVSPSVSNKFLSLLISKNRVNEAVMFFKSQILSSSSFRPDNCSFNIVMRGLCMSGKVDEAFELLDIMSLSCLPDIVTYNTLINGLCRIGNVNRAHELLRQIRSHCKCSPNVVTYTSLISGYCKSGEMTNASNLFDEMINCGIKPNLFTYNVIIDGFGKRGDLTLALKMYEKMVNSGSNPDIVTFTSLIDACSRLGEINDCLKLWDEMNAIKVTPNAFTFSILINALCKENRLNEAHELLSQLSRREDIIPRPFIYNPVIDGFCKSGNVDEANVIVEEMERKGCVHDKMTFTILILGHCMKGRTVEAIGIYNKMLSRGCWPDNVTVNCLVSCLRKAGMGREAYEIEQNVNIHVAV
ncbi:pentatricopeptide repeat-containing protein at2g06000 [Phtheirospermum japonicum]|uniref:Pentatricopeptide repeat-containing protein at2g06000 n=1 Tax=Phtheirospermum japonicum TaxID=374723 RepID=A0A830BHP0_9LAMI|nr:pentatricopeptide repeat-containing protein at2g06000 [Phtheirospermum japonicum]